ncbi:MAG: TlpA family protein disulfide reductase [Acidobacteria bacterium]|nr:MAG: TlpA family protein disulfide reductase [Acidobacteriota bacterium]
MRKITIAKWIVVAVAGVGVLWLALHPRQRAPVKLGDRAPGFTLPQLPSGRLSLSQFKGQVVVLNFWATWCPPCVMEAPSLEQFATEMKSQGVTVIGVSVDENAQALSQFVQYYHVSYPVARDPRYSLTHRYGTYKLPETYIIDRDGRVAEKIIGATNWTDPRMITFVKSLTGNTQASR